MKMKKILLTSAVAVALLSGCNNDYDGQDIAGSKTDSVGQYRSGEHARER